jgi:hypothetical protein
MGASTRQPGEVVADKKAADEFRPNEDLEAFLHAQVLEHKHSTLPLSLLESRHLPVTSGLSNQLM